MILLALLHAPTQGSWQYCSLIVVVAISESQMGSCEDSKSRRRDDESPKAVAAVGVVASRTDF